MLDAAAPLSWAAAEFEYEVCCDAPGLISADALLMLPYAGAPYRYSLDDSVLDIEPWIDGWLGCRGLLDGRGFASST